MLSPPGGRPSNPAVPRYTGYARFRQNIAEELTNTISVHLPEPARSSSFCRKPSGNRARTHPHLAVSVIPRGVVGASQLRTTQEGNLSTDSQPARKILFSCPGLPISTSCIPNQSI